MFLALILFACTAHAETVQDTQWHFADCTRRVLVRLWAPPDIPVGRPVAVRLPDAAAPTAAAVRAWDVRANHEVPVQADGEHVLLDPGTVLPPGEERLHFVYLCAKPYGVTPAARVDESWRVETERYLAQVDGRKGAAITSLLLKDGDRRIETLADGIHWWVGRAPQLTQESFGALPIERTAAGPVLVSLRVRYPNLLAEGNSLITDYRFFRDFIEIDHHYSAKQPTQLEWLKLPVSLRATGQTPGLFSNSRTRDGAMLTAGAGKWLSDLQWHDVSYLGDQPFGIGVIARNTLGGGGLFYMDSVKPEEHEWIYAEPFGWQKPVQITSDFEVKLTVVPHPAGKGRYVDTLAKIESEVGRSVSAFQTRGGPPIDSDGDSLPDLVELQRRTNPNCADTDLDGLPDGKDPDLLKGTPPRPKVALPQFKPEPTGQPQTLAQVKPVLGVPTLVLDGKPYGPMIYTRCAGSLDQLAEMGNRGFQVHFEMVGGIGWPGDQAETFRRLDDQLERFLDRVPNARIILRLYVCSPPHFARDHPDEVLTFSDGDTRHFEKWYAMKDRPLEERGYPSFASEVWRQQTAQALHHYVTHVRQTEYAKNVIGYFVCGGGTEEWYYWGDYDHNKYCVDFSKPMLRAFREYLRAMYGGDVAKLRAAWNDPKADFGTALPPGPDARRTPSAGVFYDPARDQRVRDYYYVHNKAMEDSLLVFSRAVKQACNREQLVGMFHGYLQNHWLLEGGQATLKELLASPDVDFWSAPPQYNRRGQGEHGCIRFLMASLKKHGKLWISESDIRTSFVEADNYPAFHGPPPDVPEALACLKREFAHQLCEGGNGWWFQMGKDWYDVVPEGYKEPPVLALFQQIQQLGEAAMGFDRTSDTDIAAVVDLDSLFTGPPWPVTSSLIDTFKVQELCRLGAPVDHYELDDILAPDAKRYKLYLMLNCFSLTNEERRLIDERLRRDGAVLVWMYAPGLFNPDQQPELSESHAQDLLGFPLAAETGEPKTLNMKLTEAGAAYFTGFDASRAFGSFERPEWVLDKDTGGVKQQFPGDTTLPERFYSTGAAETLARFVEGGQPAIVRCESPKATDLWIGSVMAPADLLRTVARRAGCHQFCDADEIVYANKSFLAIHTREPGARTFNLRRRADVIEVFSGDALGEGVTQFSDTIGAYRTRVYFLGNRAKWEEERRRAAALLERFQEELRRLREERSAG